MMRSIVQGAAVVGLAAAFQPAHAQFSGSQTGYVQCIIHYGDRQEVTEIVPATEVTIPRPSGATGKNIQYTLSRAFRDYLLRQGKKFWESACHENGDLAQVKEMSTRWEARKGYGVREKREIDPHQFWPGFLDYVHSLSRAAYPSLSRAAYSYLPVPSSAAVTRTEPRSKQAAPDRAKATASVNEAADTVAGAKQPALGPSSSALAAETAKREAEWQAQVAAHQEAVAAYEGQVDARAAEIARQQREIAAAREAAARQLAIHRKELAEAERRQQEYLAAQRRHALCVEGDQRACADIAAGVPALGE